MTKTLIGIILLILVASLSIGGDCDGDETAQLRLITTFQGTGGMEIAPILLATEAGDPFEFEVRYSAESTVGGDIAFSWTVHFFSLDTDILAGNPYGTFEGTEVVTFQHNNPSATESGFVFDISANTNCSWTIEVWN